MKCCLLLFVLINLVGIYSTFGPYCGCKFQRKCYRKMLYELWILTLHESPCVQDAAIGTSAITIFLKAIQQYCGQIVEVISNHMTYEGRYLYEVIISKNPNEKDNEANNTKPTIVIDAGQEGGTQSVTLALFIIEQLLACKENDDMIKKVRWVIMPSTNPDGQEYGKNDQHAWRKNLRKLEDSISMGVDISRNFDVGWESCPKVDHGFSPIYPGKSPGSENETIFIKDVLMKHKNDIKAYLSLRKDGHALLLPYGYTNKSESANNDYMVKVAADVAAKINQRAGGVHAFRNCTIFEFENKSRCGTSVDYARGLDIPLTYEMRVFDDSDNHIVSKFQTLPRGHEDTLRNGYLSGIKELYNIIVKQKYQRSRP